MSKKEQEKQVDQWLLAKVKDKLTTVRQKNKVVSTDFLDEHEQRIITDFLNNQKVTNYLFLGGIQQAERNLLIMYPEKLEELFQGRLTNTKDFITCIRIEVPNDLKGQYTHKTYLGALMKLGIERQTIGDIITDELGADILIVPKIASYIVQQLKELTRFKKAKIQIISLDAIRKRQENKKELEIIISSMRLDVIVAELTKSSRNKATQIILSGRVFINCMMSDKVSKEVEIGDKITIRGKGRFVIKQMIRKTKNGKIVLSVEKYQ